MKIKIMLGVFLLAMSLGWRVEVKADGDYWDDAEIIRQLEIIKRELGKHRKYEDDDSITIELERSKPGPQYFQVYKISCMPTNYIVKTIPEAEAREKLQKTK